VQQNLHGSVMLPLPHAMLFQTYAGCDFYHVLHMKD
jgi:hypothetical protein